MDQGTQPAARAEAQHVPAGAHPAVTEAGIVAGDERMQLIQAAFVTNVGSGARQVVRQVVGMRATEPRQTSERASQWRMRPTHDR